jgi:hypothetical protein
MLKVWAVAGSVGTNRVDTIIDFEQRQESVDGQLASRELDDRFTEASSLKPTSSGRR